MIFCGKCESYTLHLIKRIISFRDSRKYEILYCNICNNYNKKIEYKNGIIL